MRLKQTSLRLAGAALIAAAVVPWLGGGTASALAKANANTFLKASQVPTTAAAFSPHATDCPGFVASEPFDYFHFVLDGNSHDFVELTAHFNTGDVTTTTFVQGGKQAYVKAPAGATLLDAWASATPNDATVPADFQLSHVCVGTPAPPSSPPPSSSSAPPSSPPASTPPVTSAPPATTASVAVLPTKVAQTTSTPKTSVEAVAESLPKTGGGIPFTALVVISLGLLMAGGSLMLLPGLHAERSGRRRH